MLNLAALSLMLACNSSGSVMVGDVPTPSGDTGDNGDASDGEGKDNDSDQSGEYPRTWNGSRSFEFSFGCVDSIYEDGFEVTQEADYSILLDVCPQCDQVYELTASPAEICKDYGGIGVTTLTYRGLIVDGDQYTVMRMMDYQGKWYIEELGTGEMASGTITYEYNGEYQGYTYEVSGSTILD